MIAILNTGHANLNSVRSACLRLGVEVRVSTDPDELTRATHVIVPGVGTASAFMRGLHKLEVQDCLRSLKQPLLGICLGMQVLFERSEEGDALPSSPRAKSRGMGVDCLSLFPGTVKRLHAGNLPVPHMGWNTVSFCKDSLLFRGIPNESYFYFVHSFRVPNSAASVGMTDYGECFPSAIEEGSRFGTQFHPERSGSVGERLLNNFLSL